MLSRLRLLLAPVALLVLIGPPRAAYGFAISLVYGNSGDVVRWHVPQVGYVLHSAGSADIKDGSELQAVRDGFTQWNTIPCTKLQIVETATKTFDPMLSMVVGGAPNDINEVTWAEGPEWIYGQFVLGITQTSMNVPSGELVEADITFNGFENKWSTTGAAWTVDVSNVCVHEQGHFRGVQHVLGGYEPSQPPTMAPTADPDLKSASLEADDKACACFLNPKVEYTCQTDDDCPWINDKSESTGQESYVGRLKCKNGLCGGVSQQIPEGTKLLGDACASNYDCKKPLFCQQSGQGGSCAHDCQGDADCPAVGFKCFPYSNGNGGVCLPYDGPAGGPVATKEVGELCNGADECKSGMCVGSFSSGSYYCRKPCKVGGTACGADEACEQLQGTSDGACFPKQGSPATKAPGEVCESSTECQSGLCVSALDSAEYLCREKCTLSMGDCAEGFDCALLSGGGGACLPAVVPSEKKGLGATCEYSTDCVTDICLSVTTTDGGKLGPFCTTACDANPSVCPCSMGCEQFQSGKSFCVPGPPKGCIPSGNACGGDSECKSVACVEGICREPCTVGQGACPPGQACQRTSLGGTSGYCSALGGGAAGATCAADPACASLVCDLPFGGGGSKVCLAPCDPTATVCGGGLACVPHPTAGLTACGPPPPVPEDLGTATGTADVGVATGSDAGSGSGTPDAASVALDAALGADGAAEGATGGTTAGAAGGSTGGAATGETAGGTGAPRGGGCSAHARVPQSPTAWLVVASLALAWTMRRVRRPAITQKAHGGPRS